MEKIHLKTVDPVSQSLLRSAAERNLDLNWERYEKQQPQDGFLRAGLSCPYGCLQGPCRIDPFGRGAELGICGLERDQMVAALLLRLSLSGVFEALSELPEPGKYRVPSWPKPLEARASETLENLGGGELTIEEVFQNAARLHRPSETTEDLIRGALRLGMLTLALTNDKGKEATLPKKKKNLCRVRYGLLAGENPLIGLYGQPSFKFLAGLVGEAEAYKPVVELVSLGDWIATESGYLSFACTSGEAELFLSSGRINLLLCGSGIDPSIPAVCKKLEIPVVFANEAPEPLEILRLAVESYGAHARTDFFPDTLPEEAAGVVISAEALRKELRKDMQTGLVLIGGTDTPQQSFGWIATEVTPAFSGEGMRVASWGDAALWMVKRGLAHEENEQPVFILNPLRGPLEALRAVEASGNFDHLKGICYTGLNRCQDLAAALGLASLGTRVCLGSPLPLWGSKKVRDYLDAFFADRGGDLTHFDHPADATEILQWLREP